MHTFGFTTARLRQRTLVVEHLQDVLRVAHLTDLHVGWATPDGLIRSALALAETLEPDLIVLTGDFVCRGPRFLPRLVAWLSASSLPTAPLQASTRQSACLDPRPSGRFDSRDASLQPSLWKARTVMWWPTA